MPLGQGTVVVDGQRNTAPPSSAFLPMAFGAQTTGVPNVSPIVPPYASAVSGGGGSGFAAVGGYGTADNNGLVTSIAANHPYSMKVSPVFWMVGALVGGILLLQAVSWRETVEEHAKVGPVHEKADAGA